MKTANPQQGETPIVIAGTTYVVAMTFNAMIQLQQLFTVDGKLPLIEAVYMRGQAGDLEAYRAIFWASLQRHHPELSLEDVGRLIDVAGGPAQLDALLEAALAQSRPDPQDEAALGRPPKTAAAPRRRRGRTTTATST